MTKCIDCGKPAVPGQHSRFDPDSLTWDPLCVECASGPSLEEYEEAERRALHEERRINHEDFYAVLCGLE